jgi:CRISPR/Cas system-associated exonuclease Cas4 (RecB family)
MAKDTKSKVWEISNPPEYSIPENWMSFSQLNSLETCPKKWTLENSTYSEIWEKKGYPQSISKSSITGIVIHKTLETIIRALTNNNCPSVNSSEAVETINSIGGYKKTIIDCINKILDSYINNPRAEPFIDQHRKSLTSDISELRRTVQLLVSRVKLFPRIKTSSKQKSDRQHQLITGTYSEIELKHQELQWKGIIDLLILKPGYCEVRDFKTGKPKEDDKTQLHIYSLLWWRDTRLNPKKTLVDKLVISYGKHGDVYVPTLKENELLNFESKLKVRTLKTIEAASIRPPKANTCHDNCRYCGVRHLCNEYWDNKAEQIQIEKSTKGLSYGDLQVKISDRMGESSWNGIVEKGPVDLIKKKIYLRASNIFFNLNKDSHVRLLGAQLFFPEQVPSNEQTNLPTASTTKSNEIFFLKK